MRIKGLLTSQSDLLFLKLAEAGWNPTNDFKWESAGEDAYPKLVHKASDYYFLIYFSGNVFSSAYSPSEDSISGYGGGGNFSNLLIYFSNWLVCLNRELAAPDFWANMPSDSKLIETAATDDLNTKFTAAEKKNILTGMDEIKEYLLTTHKVQSELVESQIKYLIDSSSRLGRKDWKNALIGAVFGIVMQSGVGSHAAQEIFQFIWTILSAVLMQKVFLPA